MTGTALIVPEPGAGLPEPGVEPDAGRLGMWVFLASEVLFFGGLFVCYVYGRSSWPQGFAIAARRTDVVLGTLNTGLLLTSSALVAAAVACAEHPGARRWTSRLLAAAAALGVAFLAVKGVEWHDDWRQDLVPGPRFALRATAGAQLFFVLYFLTTGLHALHMTVGVGVLATFARAHARGVRWAADPRHVEVAAMYWHFVDIVWIFLYPLLYLVKRHA
ncbi:MAG TPA: cytochrome c oxidase subunit 3 [Burkholderiaceae bacterium]